MVSDQDKHQDYPDTDVNADEGEFTVQWVLTVH